MFYIDRVAYFYIYTRLTFLGLHPLCGIGVTSFIEITFIPWVTKVLTADSRPAPIPFIKTSILSIPIFLQAFAIVSATLDAAKEVDFLAPLNPTDPADFHAKTCPFEFVRVNIVLL